MSATKPQHTQPCLEQWLLMSENVRDEYRREGFYDPSALIDPLPLNGRAYRLYCTQYSNAGSVWFKVKGRTIYVN